MDQKFLWNEQTQTTSRHQHHHPPGWSAQGATSLGRHHRRRRWQDCVSTLQNIAVREWLHFRLSTHRISEDRKHSHQKTPMNRWSDIDSATFTCLATIPGWLYFTPSRNNFYSPAIRPLATTMSENQLCFIIRRLTRWKKILIMPDKQYRYRYAACCRCTANRISPWDIWGN